jgi:DNA-binding beta-propeller fold protein YncE
MTGVKLVDKLSGAIGCYYIKSKNQLVFVEVNNGQISAIVPGFSPYIIKQNNLAIAPKSTIDLDGDGTPDLGVTDNLNLKSIGSAKIHILSANELAARPETLPNFVYSANPSGFANKNFVVLTNSGNYSVIKVTMVDIAGKKIIIEYITYGYHSQGRKVLGVNYHSPLDIVVTSGGRYAYVTEGEGNLIKVDLNSANRNPANIILSGLSQPHQMALDETRNQVYLVEHASSGNLTRIDLGSKIKTILTGGLQYPFGLLMTKDFNHAYVTELAGVQGMRLSCIDLSTGFKEVISTGLIASSYLAWADSTESRILITEGDPANRVTLLDLESIPVNATPLLTTSPAPRSVAIVLSDSLIVCCIEEIDQINLDDKYFNSSSPLLMGIGFVPKDRIIDGYADTTKNPVTGIPEDYFFKVKDSPFGGTLPIMLNHELARKTAKYYSITVDGIAQTDAWTDYKWDPIKNAFVLTAATQKIGDTTKFLVRQANELWYNHWLGYFLNTSVLSNGLHTILVSLFKDDGTPLQTQDQLKVMIDNQWPSASIDEIFHDGNLVKACDIVKSGSRLFTFHITAQDPEQHLMSWDLTALWGNNKYKLVDSDNYGKHISAAKKWQGVAAGQDVPAKPWDVFVSGDPTSNHCAHTFRLSVCDRVINGWNYLHYNEYHKSITIDLP